MIKVQEDIVLIQSILEGNQEAEETLYNKYKQIITDFLGSKYSLYHDTEDDVSEIMIKMFVKLNSFDSTKGKFKSWVLSIAKNHMTDKWRSDTVSFSTNNNNSVTLCNSSDSYYITSDTTSFPAMGATLTLSNCCAGVEFENCSSINYISDQISPQDFTLLDMKYVQGYNYTEIGDEFNVTSSTISNRVNYIKTKLKKDNSEIIYD